MIKREEITLINTKEQEENTEDDELGESPKVPVGVSNTPCLDKFDSNIIDFDTIVKDVDYNCLIDYLTITISSFMEFSMNDVITFKNAITNDKNFNYARDVFFNIVERDELFKKLLFEILRCNRNDLEFWYGSNGYLFGVKFGEYVLSFDGPENRYNRKTIMLEMKGQSCRYFEELDCSYLELAEFLFNEYKEFNVSRMDNGMDVFTGEISIYELISKIRMGEYTTRAKNIKYIETFEGIKLTGQTIYVGSSIAGQQLCIYDKKLERNKKEVDVFTTYWLRFEMRFNGDMAKSAFKELMENGFKLNEYTPGVICGFIVFKESLKIKTNKAMNKNWIKWVNLINNAKLHKVKNQFKIESTFTSKRKWFNYSMLKMLCNFFTIDKEYLFTDLREKMFDKFDELTHKDLIVINNYLKKENPGFTDMALEDLKNFKYFLKKRKLIKEYVPENEDVFVLNIPDRFHFKDGLLIGIKTGEILDYNNYYDYKNIHSPKLNVRRIERDGIIVKEFYD